MAYDAFISYSHSADGRLAPAVQSGLQRLARPWHRMRALRVFRDETGLSVNPHLWGSIEAALNESDYFVLLASPESARSPWVAREIEHWMATKPVERILPVLTDGDLVWDSAAGAYDLQRSTSLPAVLATAFLVEPRHLDLRFARTEEQLDLRHAEFRAAIAALAAPMHGVSRDELEGQDVSQHRRTMRIAWGGAALLFVVAIAAVVSAMFAVRYAANVQANEQRAVEEGARARRNAQEAARQRSSAVANANTAQAAQQRSEENADLAARNAADAEAERVRAEQNAQAASTNAEEANQNAALAEANGREAESQTVAAQRNAARASANALVAETNATRAAANAQAAAQSAADAQASADVAAAQRDLAQRNAAEAASQQAAAEESATQARSRQLAASALNSLSTAPDRSLLMSVQANHLDTNTQSRDSAMRTLQRQPAELQSYIPADPALGKVSKISTSPDGRVLLSVGSEGRVALWDLDREEPLPAPIALVAGPGRGGVWFSHGGTRLVIAAEDSLVLWDIDRGQQLANVDRPSEFLGTAAVSVDDRLLAVAAGSEIRLLDVDATRPSGAAMSIALPEGFEAFRLALSADRALVAVSGISGFDTQAEVLVFATTSGERIATLAADVGVCSCIVARGSLDLRFDGIGDAATLTSVARGSQDYSVITWDVGSWERTSEVANPEAIQDSSEVTLAVDPAGNRIATGSRTDSLLRIRDLTTGETLRSLPAEIRFCSLCGAHVAVPSSVAFGSGRTVVALGTDRLLRRFATGPTADRLVTSLPTVGPFFSETAISADGQVAAVLGIASQVSVYSTGDGRPLGTIGLGGSAGGTIIALSPDGSTLIAQRSSYDLETRQGLVELGAWDVASGDARWLDQRAGIATGSIVVDPSGRLLAAIAAPATFEEDVQDLEMRDLATGALLSSSPVPTFSAAPAFSADGRFVALTSAVGQAPQLYGVAERRIVQTLDDPRLAASSRLVFSADGRTAVAPQVDGNRVVVLDAPTFTVTGELDAAADVQGLALSPDASLIAIGFDRERGVQLYEVGTGDTFGDPFGQVAGDPPGSGLVPAATDLTWSRDGRSLVMFRRSTLLQVDLDPESWLSQSCRLAGRNLRFGEWTALLGDAVPYQRTCPGFPANN